MPGGHNCLLLQYCAHEQLVGRRPHNIFAGSCIGQAYAVFISSGFNIKKTLPVPGDQGQYQQQPHSRYDLNQRPHTDLPSWSNAKVPGRISSFPVFINICNNHSMSSLSPILLIFSGAFPIPFGL